MVGCHCLYNAATDTENVRTLQQWGLADYQQHSRLDRLA